MKDEYLGQSCSICGAPADGLHYGAVSCRSCNAFFRRTVVEKAEYRCKHNGTCIIDPEGRCGCRACRFSKCLQSGMKLSSVQPRRDPTGSQKERRKRQAMENASVCMDSPQSSLTSEQSPGDFSHSKAGFIYDSLRSSSCGLRRISFSRDSTELRNGMQNVKIEMDEERPCTSQQAEKNQFPFSIDAEEAQEFTMLVFAYREHTRMMQLNFATFESFLDEIETGLKLREMCPTDVDKLSTTELTGLLYWIEKMTPYTELPKDDRENLLKRYSVRKLSLDHFYSASKHPDYVAKRKFVMNNYTYVPEDKTGFELPGDDEKQIAAKKETFANTFDRFWQNVIFPFVDIKITDAEIVYLQLMLMWSISNNEHVTLQTRTVMKERREWAMKRLFEWYATHNQYEPGIRFGQITLLLGEIEIICDMHCQDFQVAKLFEFVDMSKYWYEQLAYAPVNTITVKYDPFLMENLKKFTALGLAGQMGVDLQNFVVDTSAPFKNIVTRQAPTSSRQVTVAAGVRDEQRQEKQTTDTGEKIPKMEVQSPAGAELHKEAEQSLTVSASKRPRTEGVCTVNLETGEIINSFPIALFTTPVL